LVAGDLRRIRHLRSAQRGTVPGLLIIVLGLQGGRGREGIILNQKIFFVNEIFLTDK
jgi:hypothetical protein